MPAEYYFTSPKEAVPVITKLLKQQNFKMLAAYYDLSNSGIKRSELESGDFFIRKDRPEIAHPGGFWKYKHPFAPGFKYSSDIPAAKENVHKVEVMISIDQGADMPEQTGFSYFYMIKSEKGWRLRPELVNENKTTVID